MTANDMPCREAFEKWCESVDHGGGFLTRNPQGGYHSTWAAGAWAAWQAAWNHRSEGECVYQYKFKDQQDTVHAWSNCTESTYELFKADDEAETRILYTHPSPVVDNAAPVVSDDWMHFPLERFGVVRVDGSPEVARIPDGYWTPWHIAHERVEAWKAALTAALQGGG